ncbi:MAG: hypothetical protein JWM35_903 [Verrucomicrobia bacterium]|nr:hypothetical protein [Verrucomicrobiota bacterium]
MKPLRFILTALGVFAVLAAMYLAAFGWALQQPVWPYHWLRNVYVVKDRLAREASAPRCLILGGSSVWFGFQGGLLEKATGQHVINLGTHAEVPLEFQLWQAERLARRGDTVLFAGELVYYWPRAPYTTYAATEVMLMAPDFWRQSSLRGKYELLAAIPPTRVVTGIVSWAHRGTKSYAEHLRLSSSDELMENLRARWAGTFQGALPSHYNYLEMDSHGDIVRPRVQAPHPHEDYGLASKHVESAEIWRRFGEFARTMQARGVRCVATWPPFERHAGFDLDAAPVRANLDFLRSHLTAAGWEVIGEPEDGAMTSEFFYDTPYHLTTEGARLRTERLAARWRTVGEK